MNYDHGRSEGKGDTTLKLTEHTSFHTALGPVEAARTSEEDLEAQRTSDYEEGGRSGQYMHFGRGPWRGRRTRCFVAIRSKISLTDEFKTPFEISLMKESKVAIALLIYCEGRKGR
jgi:hypothetical protein